jgi:hypothetical protein
MRKASETGATDDPRSSPWAPPGLLLRPGKARADTALTTTPQPRPTRACPAHDTRRSLPWNPTLWRVARSRRRASVATTRTQQRAHSWEFRHASAGVVPLIGRIARRTPVCSYRRSVGQGDGSAVTRRERVRGGDGAQTLRSPSQAAPVRHNSVRTRPELSATSADAIGPTDSSRGQAPSWVGRWDVLAHPRGRSRHPRRGFPAEGGSRATGPRSYPVFLLMCGFTARLSSIRRSPPPSHPRSQVCPP